MGDNKGQVTLFIIIAIIIVAIVVVFFVFRDSFEGERGLSIEIAPIANFVQECMDTTLESTLYNISKQGGYSGYSYLSRETTDSGINYYLFEGKSSFPSKNLVENQIEEYFERKFFLCTNQFSNFQDYSIEEGLLEISVSIEDDEIKLKAKYPLTIIKGESVSKIENFESKISSRFGTVYNAVSDFMEQQEDSETICLSCLNLAIKNDIYVSMENSYDGTILFTFRDNSSKLNDNPLEWVFANKY